MSATELEIILIIVTHKQMEMKRVAAICRTADAAQMHNVDQREAEG
jgi:hypothetical protein